MSLTSTPTKQYHVSVSYKNIGCGLGLFERGTGPKGLSNRGAFELNSICCLHKQSKKAKKTSIKLSYKEEMEHEEKDLSKES